MMGSFVAVSQQVMNCNLVEKAIWSKKSKDWVWTPIKDTTVSFTIEGTKITCNSQPEIFYTTGSVLYKNKNYMSWEAKGPINQDYIVGIGKKNKYRYIIIINGDLCSRYYW
jgi:hypothetical protein